MAELDLKPRLSDAQADQHSFELGRIGLIVACAVIALIAGYVGGGVRDADSWAALASKFFIVAVALILAVALLRIVDMINLRRRVSKQAERSRAFSNRFRELLEMQSPGVAQRARKIDAEALIDRALQKEDHTAASSRSESKLGI
jgi:hypothetical protein